VDPERVAPDGSRRSDACLVGHRVPHGMRAGSARQRAGRGPARAALVVAGALVASLLVAASPAHAEVLRPEDAPSHVGEEVTVEGEVASVVCSPLACLLSFSTDFSGLVASIDGDDVPRFPPPRET